MKALRRLGLGLVLGLLVLLGASCHRRRATPADCQQILDRIIELELSERGFRDPALAARKQRELRSKLSGEIEACQGRLLSTRALACVRSAGSTE